MDQYQVDGSQALRVLASVTDVWQQLAEGWQLENPQNILVLSWAALLHEIGLTMSSHNYPTHGAYLINNTELSGFNKSQQLLLAAMIASQSGEISTQQLHELPEEVKADSWRLLIALRLAKILRTNREETPPTKLEIRADGTQLFISMLPTNHPDIELLWAALVDECQYQKQVGFEIALQGNLQLTSF
jgi:exopolyphosphatase/guanosine-5'-triphosphate,3'-diphosphate pyrophosphatase